MGVILTLQVAVRIKGNTVCKGAGTEKALRERQRKGALGDTAEPGSKALMEGQQPCKAQAHHCLSSGSRAGNLPGFLWA